MVVPSSPRIYMPPHTLLSNDIIDAHVATARNQSAWSKEVRDSEFPALWAVLGQNSAIQDHYVNAALYGQGHSGQVTAEVTQLRNILLNMQPPARVVCETGFNAGHSAAVWLEPPSAARLISFDLPHEPYSESSQAFVHRLYPGRLTYHGGDTMQSLPKYSARVVAGLEPPCDLWFIDGGHTRPVPASDLEHAWRASHNRTIVVADDCTSRFQDVRDAWHQLMNVEGKLARLNESYMPQRKGLTDGSSRRFRQMKPAPGQPKAARGEGAHWRPHVYVVGIKGWCSGFFVKPARECKGESELCPCCEPG